MITGCPEKSKEILEKIRQYSSPVGLDETPILRPIPLRKHQVIAQDSELGRSVKKRGWASKLNVSRRIGVNTLPMFQQLARIYF
jgi:hypothetical protein